MVTIVKHEWHQVDSQFAFELSKDTLEEIYPDMDEDELEQLWQEVEAGEADLDEILNDAWDNDVEIEWDRQYDDWWTDRKGGYDITYEYGDESSWHKPDTPPEPTHKCTKCRWTGQSYETLTQHLRKDGSVIEDYYGTDEVSHDTKDVCPMCDSDVELTMHGFQEEKERKEREERWSKDLAELDLEEDVVDEEEFNAECTSCVWEGPEADTITVEGVMCCPECREPVYTAEQVQERKLKEFNQALDENTKEFQKFLEEANKK